LTIEREGAEPEAVRYGRKDLLEDLLEVMAGQRAELICPLGRLGAFMGVVERLDTFEPRSISRAAVTRSGPDDDRRLVIEGVDGALDEAARRGGLLSELGVSWAVRDVTGGDG
jgi:hypothetical protein